MDWILNNLDWVAGSLELVAIFLIGYKWRHAFLLFIICNITWIHVALARDMHGLLLVVIPAIFLNTRNWFKWRREYHDTQTTRKTL